ncbi:hypothetical protein BJ170DRAFT_593897 [Xylariales sp. AK1849]|nr:hypothetical protein BJ170DRAFT_593897 [Xylariales sp. AK1849]
MQGMCYATPDVQELNTAFEYYFNFTGQTQVNSSEVGVLSWNLPAYEKKRIVNLPSAMSLHYDPNSNVAQPLLIPGDTGALSVGFDKDGRLFTWEAPERFPGTPPLAEGIARYDWFLCWQYFNSYYLYNAVAWAQSLPPQNPTCHAIDIKQSSSDRLKEGDGDAMGNSTKQ